MPFGAKAALLDNASGGDVVGVEQRLDADHSAALCSAQRERRMAALVASPLPWASGAIRVADAHNPADGR